MCASALTAASLRSHLEECGYNRRSRLAINYKFDSHTIPIAGFFGTPWDARSACLAVVDMQEDSRATATQFLEFGAPTALVCRSDGLDWWKLSSSGATEFQSVRATELDGFFREHARDLTPESIYGAKLRRPEQTSRQLWFVDVGFLPTIERRAGENLHHLVTGAIADLSVELKGQLKSKKNYADLYKTVFWILAAKLLNEKGVEKFKRLSLINIDEVFKRVSKHYADVEGLPPGGKAWRPAIESIAKSIAQWGHMGNLSSEAVAYLYEKALIDKKPTGKHRKLAANVPDIRKELGIHSTPPVLVDHMLSQMWPLIEQIPVIDRRVFEPACGHAGFLVAAMRWLRDYSGMQEGLARHRYLCDRLFGIEIDPFARELAKLSLTLADVPHGNSWQIQQEDMFAPGVLVNAAKNATVLLANPPYEAFKEANRLNYKRLGESVEARTKAVEMLRRTVPHLQPGAVFGVIVPKGFLHDQESQPVRKELLHNYELSEVTIFADNLFEESDHEAAVLIGQRTARPTSKSVLTYRRVREREMETFKEQRSFSHQRQVPQARFVTDENAGLLLPDLVEVWDYLRNLGALDDLADIQQGFQFVNKKLREGREVESKTKRSGWVKAVLRAAGDFRIWELPDTVWINPAPENIRTTGPLKTLRIPQVLVNYAPVARDPWRLKAVIDREGIAVSSRFVVVRPKLQWLDRRCLWALLNSPVANAYAYCHSGKRETLVKEWRAFPCGIPTVGQHNEIITAAEHYLTTARRADTPFSANEEDIKKALLALDAAVLRFYDFPPKLERQLLDLFDGVERKGVGCDFRGYYPSGLDAFVPLHELISEDYKRSLLGNFRKNHRPEDSESILAALRIAANDFSGE